MSLNVSIYLLIRSTGRPLVLVKSRCHIFEVDRCAALFCVYLTSRCLYLCRSRLYAQFSYLYLHRNGMAAFHFACTGRHSFPGDGFYPYNLKKLSKNSYIHIGAECHNALRRGGWRPIMRRVIKIYKRECRRQQGQKAKRNEQNTEANRLMIIVFRR